MSKEDAGRVLLTTLSKDKWKNIGTQRRAGIVAPLFSIYSKHSIGIGEIDDLKLLVNWCVKTGHSIIQLLPMNEVGPLFCPYDSISSFAIEPSYISLRLLESSGKKNLSAKIEKLKKNLPCDNPYVNYSIKSEKLKILWEMYLGAKDLEDKDFKKFIKDNSYWINDFAIFKVMKFVFEEKPWYEWPRQFCDRDKEALDRFEKDNSQAILYHKWVQWNLFKQFSSVKDFAAGQKVLFKGDLPVLVSKDSADVWANKIFFKLDLAAGAPPDMYCSKGQRWGMPTYNWQNIENDNYRYLKEKLKFAQNFYDILRIDHVVGLFRIWSIPVHYSGADEGLNGFFDPSNQDQWEEHGRKILSIIAKNSNMLLCAEDLGMIPPSCTKTLKEFGIPGNDIQRWVKDWQVTHDFLDPKDYRLLSVAMLSTHDTTNWAAWWENEAGTIDEALFRRKCAERGIDYNYVSTQLFDLKSTKYGRLYWQNCIDYPETLTAILGKPKEQVKDFIEMYENTYQEKLKLWEKMGKAGQPPQKATADVMAAAMGITLDSNAIFSVQLLTDWLIFLGVLKGDSYQYRINRPGTISDKNWSLVYPISLEDLLNHKGNSKIKKMISDSARP